MSEASAAATQPAARPNVVVGVAGGIAAYKACHLVRLFTESGHNVRVVPTEAACNFVGPATFEALSGNPVSVSVFEAVDEVRHVHVGQHADLVVIAPATADLLARLAAGRADDLLTATCLVATCPVVVAPAMHTEMWNNPATQDNVATLRRRGVVVLEPAHGRLTGKDTGPGRLLDPEQIFALAEYVRAGGTLTRDLEGLEVLITAGGTREAIDPVRFIGNQSSGKQGFALGEVAAQRGAHVTVIAGATAELPTPAGAEVVRIRSARDLQAAVAAHAPTADVIVMAAAVADYRPATLAESKLKKGQSDDALSQVALVENPDILRGLVAGRAAQAAGDSAGAGEELPAVRADATIVGFAAETGDAHASAEEYGRQKLARKGCDLLMCNEVGDGVVFGQATNQGWLLSRTGEDEVVPLASKYVVAGRILDAAVRLRGAAASHG
ncbi:bifunctional phosphopantothenoylcysteine decarboxylase/phosphopantothenate--cysteine ligase CoaBC [Corynebacterium sp. 13CS0277]|uniref:bifunctional phosphopantothenoylcysteine decarboxylase/phosphopantothenate--cysteine ligase CoaBC n=1 Tax=Corynebacterium sp. 13CS0277 TaxID=2071994 RepID=UPI000D03132B|nr:bifunctional phosphopantothenoylcysteine decarboxylase/phosphopantothenate--cysteine ligase CoaBC [Corynebacterium sp. 13CS0277]PRQ11938.1 bifunctional phosphopantothenoylcysteine decarboxylase/phosphopantothenate--cysteine ligase CoaBC [Corynebacterium sp. 13CS0277]